MYEPFFFFFLKQACSFYYSSLHLLVGIHVFKSTLTLHLHTYLASRVFHLISFECVMIPQVSFMKPIFSVPSAVFLFAVIA